mmetsp:Transcript_20686/g.28643  ORF Transcript_20686/g.28643 Transcript_20686/m.28643 type:complete len:597 (+) Transcript_20686:1-1791(+)
MTSTPLSLTLNLSLLSKRHREIAAELIELGQSHLFESWDAPGSCDREKCDFMQQLESLDNSYIGGLKTYIVRARSLLEKAKAGDNPFDGWIPEVPSGKILEPFSEDYLSFEEIGKTELGKCGFILVAGGLGERLGYNGIKLELPAQTLTNTSYLETYCQQILAIQSRYGSEECPLPLAIMVSDDTAEKTAALLARSANFGLRSDQITLLRQGKVPALISNDAKLALAADSKYLLDAKPHGHGDVHSLMHSTGTAASWLQRGLRWAVFLQDTNALALLTLPAMLGVSSALSLEVNSLAIQRAAKQAIGAIARLVHSASGDEMTVNVEYNQLDPLLRAQGAGMGDENDPTTGHSPFPGNINQLLFSLEPYVATLQRSKGVMPEFVNPKYADNSKTHFKKPTRLECMMQDYPRLLTKTARVGFSMAPAWLCYSPCKNNSRDAAESVKAGIPAGSAFTAESDQLTVYAELLRRLGANMPAAAPQTFLGITAVPGPRIVLHPSFALFPHELKARFPQPHKVRVTAQSSLLLAGDVTVDCLSLAGSLQLSAPPGVAVVVNTGQGEVVNDGHELLPLDQLKDDVSEVYSTNTLCKSTYGDGCK